MRPSILFSLLAAAAPVFAVDPSPPQAQPAVAPRQTTAAAAGPLVCSTATTTSGQVCSVIPKGTTSTSTCSTAAITTSVCVEGLICFTEGASVGKCMKRDNSLTTSGLVVTIVFVVGLLATIAILVGMACMEKSKAKKLARERVALLGGSKKAMEDIEVVKPYKIGGGGEGGGDEPLAKGAESAAVPQIKLHQGIGALGGQNDDHWSNDYGSSGNAQQQNRMI